MTNFRRTARLLLAAMLCLLLGAQGAIAQETSSAEPPGDYVNLGGLSEVQYAADDIERTAMHLTTFDGEKIYLEITKPKDAVNLPVILEASPYHGTIADRDGTRMLPDPKVDGKSIGMTGYFAPRGYAVVMMDLRGTGRSSGCLDHLGPFDTKDLKTVIEWLAEQPWSNGKVGMTGHSYVGSTPMAAASTHPKGLATIVPSAGLASMYDHQFQGGVPFFLQWAGPQWAYPYLSVLRHLPPGLVKDPVQGGQVGDNFGNDMEYFGCGAKASALLTGEDQLSGRYAAWHAARDHSAGAASNPIPMFLIHGVNDNAARITAADWFLSRNNPADKAWIGQWDHGSGFAPTRRGMQATRAIHAWFDKHLMGRDVDTGPRLEAFLNTAPSFGGAKTTPQEEVFTASAWPPASTMTTFHTSGSDLVATPPAAETTRTFSGDGSGFLLVNPQGRVDYTTPTFEQDTTIVGLPELDLVASVTAPRVHLIATLYVRSGSTLRRITQFAMNPELRDGKGKLTPVVPGQKMTLKPPAMAMAHSVKQGQQLVLRVTTSDPDKAPLFPVDPRVTVFSGAEGTQLRLPVVTEGAIYPDDIPLE